jgi:DNA-directed RNA polymerase II subunit RPB2
MTTINHEDTWEVVKLHLQEQNVASNHINSYNDFMNTHLKNIVERYGTIVIDSVRGKKNLVVEITFKNIRAEKPKTIHGEPMYPMEARYTPCTYSSKVFIDLHIKRRIGNNRSNTSVLKHVMLCEIPTMVGSEYCNFHGCSSEDIIFHKGCPTEKGGYFIVNGSEKVIIGQERTGYNYIQLSRGKVKDKHSIRCDVYSEKPACYACQFTMFKRNEYFGSIDVKMSGFTDPIPLFIIFMAYGATTVEDMTSNQSVDNIDMMNVLLGFMNEDTMGVKTQEDALFYLGNKIHVNRRHSTNERTDQVKHVLNNKCLPHINTDWEGRHEKVFFMQRVLIRLMRAHVNSDTTLADRDHYAYKRVDISGALLASRISGKYGNMIYELKRRIPIIISKSARMDWRKIISSVGMKITKAFVYSLGTGVWKISSRDNNTKTGYAQKHDRMNFESINSQFKRINNSIPHRKDTRPRNLHNTQRGRLCPSETPEGEGCGNVKNMSVIARVTGQYSTHILEKDMVQWKCTMLKTVGYKITEPTVIYINGKPVACTSDVSSFKQCLRKYRYGDMSRRDISIHYDDEYDEIHVWCDSGRIVRPVFVVNNNQTIRCKKKMIESICKGSMSLEQLYKRGIIEDLDVAEEMNCIVSTVSDMKDAPKRPKHLITHCDIEPSMILGICASMLPYPDHNQAPRVIYGGAMSKQAVSVPMHNFQYHMSTSMDILMYPQKPLVHTRVSKLLGGLEKPSGMNAIVAIMCDTGYNMEDSVEMNQDSIDRGLFRSHYFRSYKDEERREGNYTSKFEKPDLNECRHTHDHAFYDVIDDDGIIEPGVHITPNHLLFSQTMEVDEEDGNGTTKVSSSVRMKKIGGCIDRVIVTSNQEKKNLHSSTVRIRQVRVPEIGDKFASRHGQKGTVGITYKARNLPRTADGITPDIIVNSHGIPSRMTCGQLMETITGKYAALEGESVDATPFNHKNMSYFSEKLKNRGYSSSGKEILYHGRYGTPIECEVFIGPTYYLRLKHMAANKVHSRTRGSKHILTQQPTEGRARGGGLRFGEMERDNMISQGCTAWLQERLMGVSDEYKMSLCKECGYQAIEDQKEQRNYCRVCSGTSISRVTLPYAMKLLTQELMSTCMSVRPMTT